MEPTWVAIKIGGATGAAMFATAKLDDGSVSVTAAVSIAVFVSGVAWWLSRRFAQIDVKLDAVEKSLKDLPCQNCPHKK